MRDHGRNEAREIVMWGYNSRLDNLQAAVLNYKLSYYQEEIDRRREIASIYQKNLAGIKELHLPPAPDSDRDYYDVYQNYEIEAEDRDKLRVFLAERRGWAVHTLKNLGFKDHLPFTDKVFERCMVLPLNTTLPDEDIIYVCDKIKAFYNY